jgi:hypothetical protein
MNDSHKLEFSKILSGIAEIRGKPLSRDAMSMYWLALHDWDIDDFRGAAAHLVSNSQFMPTPYDFEQLRKAGEPTAGEAWQQVRQAIKHRHHTDQTSISPKIDKIVAIMGGWTVLGHTNTDEMHFREKRFAELWDEISDVENVRLALPAMAPANALEGPKRDVALLTQGLVKKLAI